MSFAAIFEHWKKFWFAPQDVTAIALYRIAYGLLILQIAVIHLGEHFKDWYGPDAIVTIDTVIKCFWHNEPRFDLLLLLPQTNAAFASFHLVFIASAAALTIGFFTRYSALIVWLSLLSLHHHDPFNINGGDAFLRAVGPWLALSYCGEKFSLDSWLGKKTDDNNNNDESRPPWAQRMIQIQLALVYWQTFACKVTGSQWLDGSAIYYATRLDDMFRFPAPLISDNLLMLKVMNWSTLIIELAGWTLIWFKETRYWVLVGLLGLHLGIDYMINLPVFEWAFIATLITFIPGQDIKKCFKLIARKGS